MPPGAEESIAVRTKLRKRRADKIAKKEKTKSPELFNRYLGYSGPSDMYKTLNDVRTTEKNKARVNEIENRLTGLIEMLRSNPTSYEKKKKKKIETEIIYWKLLNVFFTLIN